MGASYDVKIAALVQSPLRRVARVEHSVTEDNLVVEWRVGTRWLIPEKTAAHGAQGFAVSRLFASVLKPLFQRSSYFSKEVDIVG